jgi:hypothetical protein
LDDRSFRAVAVGPDGIRKAAQVVLIERSVDHDGHFKPTHAEFELDAAGLPDGDYTLRLSVLNLQGTYRLRDTLTFHLEGGVVTS